MVEASQGRPPREALWPFWEVFPAGSSKVFPRFSQKVPQGVPKVSPRCPQGAPKASQGVPKVPQGVPKGFPKTFLKDPTDFFKISKKPRKNNGFSMIFRSMLASSWRQVEPRWLMLLHAGLSSPQIGRTRPHLVPSEPQVAPSWSHVDPCWTKLATSWSQVGSKLAPRCPLLAQVVQVGPN